ncbi:MAG: DUF3623 family protein [Chloroflexi bacterium]|uniref:DUF3623 family protein n=1 Tax=Candidatus Chlorohelix allophototropha TaxID=3003348 RepID=A0A8T7M569_9CHLR|nr:DUF3623 family protein [Chloroflexota bacterium]WJW69169.1 putative photosynthetic complex assembly protein PuhE [Chloroflexota bacterium L227-S17]
MNFWIDVLPSVVAAIFIWWGATGIIIYLCGRRTWRPWVFGVVTLAQPFAFWQVMATRDSHDVGGVFAQFFWAIIIWSWIETSYYSGFIVGRKNIPEIEPGTSTGLRFRRAIAANLYHELMIIGLSIAVVIVGWGGSNETGLWTFMILHWTHQSAKINIFLGINNLTTEYLPDNLKYMAQYFSQKPLNSFFPFSATISTIIATALFISAAQSNTAGEQAGQALLFVLMVAAVIEHWWLVTPVPSKAWDWALKSRKADQQQLPTIQVVCGYLGSGKTTLIRHLLPQFDERVAVLVNDFGAVGIDAELIRGDNAAGMVVELPGGCVCCTLQKNLSGQIINLLETFKPERVIIEPSGVAGIEEIVKALASPRLVKRVANVEVVAVIEAPRLLAAGGLPEFVVTQIKAAGAIVISKTDLVQPGEVGRVAKVVSALNHKARVITAINGQVALTELFAVAPELPAEEEHEAHQHDEENGGLISFGEEYTGEFDPQALRDLFVDLRDGHYGPVIRAKGIFHARGGRLAWDLASGNITERILTPPLPDELPGGRFMAIAEDLTTEQLQERLQGCIIPAVSL